MREVKNIFNNKGRINIGIFSVVAVVFVLLLSIGYSAFVSTLNVSNVVATVRRQIDIRVTGIAPHPSSTGSSRYEDYNVDNLITGVTLPDDNSTVTYKVTVTNFGNVKMGIRTITGLPDNLTYELTSYTIKDPICASENNCTLGASQEFLITIKYKTGGRVPSVTDYNLVIHLEFRRIYDIFYTNIGSSWKYPKTFMDGDNIEITFDPAPQLINTAGGWITFSYSHGTLSNGNYTGDFTGYTDQFNGDYVELIGTPCAKDEIPVYPGQAAVFCGNQIFWILNETSNNVELIAFYGLVNGKQDAGGDKVVYSQTPYWSSISSGTFVYDSRSDVYPYVESYVNYLKSLGINKISGTLIDYEKYLTTDKLAGYSANIKSWLFDNVGAGYWTGNAAASDRVFKVYDNGVVDVPSTGSAFSASGYVRPVINISPSEIGYNTTNTKSPCSVVSGTGDNMGDKIRCGDEYFYVLSSTPDGFETLAEYTLDKSGTTVKQGANSNLKLYFSDSGYWDSTTYPNDFIYNSNSLLYSYVEDYVKYLKSLGLSSASGTLIDYYKYLTLDKQGSYNDNIKSWLLPSGMEYWTGSAATFSPGYVFVLENGHDNFRMFNSYPALIRPVINMSRSEVDQSTSGQVACTVVSGTGKNMGDKIKCGKDEYFYVLSYTSDNVEMLAEQYLTTANNQSGNVYVYPNFGQYWTASNYPAFVYDSRSDVYPHVENYVDYLKDYIGVTSAKGTLVDHITAMYSYKYNSPLAWSAPSMWWTGTAYNNDMMYVASGSANDVYGYFPDYSAVVRPVINISPEQIYDRYTPYRPCSVVTGWGNGSNMGDMIKCGDELFYVLSSKADSFEVLAAYPLDQSGATVKQNANSTLTSRFSLSSVNVPSAYDSNSLLYSYVEDYVKYLKTLGLYNDGKANVTGTLIDYNTYLTTTKINSYSADIKEWLIPSTMHYWTGTAMTSWDVWTVYNGRVTYEEPNMNYHYIRPVINIPKSNVDTSYKTKKCYVASGTGKTMGSKIRCGDEYFYVLSYTSNNIEMLAEHPIATSGSTIKQVAGSYMTVRFASSQYWTTSGFVYNSNSLLYSYVEDYVKYLKSLGLSSVSGTLIDYDKYLTSTKMNSYSANIKSWLTPSSLYYWTGTSLSMMSNLYQVENGVVTFEHYSDTGHIRPVINMSPSEVTGLN